MDKPREPEPDIAEYEYPPVVDSLSGPLPSNKYMPKSSRKIETTLPKPELTVGEHVSWFDPASVTPPFAFKHTRTRSLPETTLPVSKATADDYPPAVIHGSTLPSKTNTTRADSNIESALDKPGVAIGAYPPSANRSLVARDTKKHRRSFSSGGVVITQPALEVGTEDHEPGVSPHMLSSPSWEHRGNLSGSKTVTTLPQPKADIEQYSPLVRSESLPLFPKKDKPDPCLNPKTTPLEPQITPGGYVLWIDPAPKSQPTKQHRVSSNASNFTILPPQEWIPNTYNPIINPASIPLPNKKHRHYPTDLSTTLPTIPSIILTTPDDQTEKPSDSTTKAQRADGPEILDSSRLHPNAAWSQLANWTHKTNLKLVDENDMLRVENAALKAMFVKFSRVLGDMGRGEQVEFQRRLEELPVVPPKGESAGPRGAW
jgi:hypothetical protein